MNSGFQFQFQYQCRKVSSQDSVLVSNLTFWYRLFLLCCIDCFAILFSFTHGLPWKYPIPIFCAWEIIFPFEDHYKTILFWLLASYRDFSSDRYFPRKLFLLSSICWLPQKKACLWQPVWVDYSLCIWTFTLFVIVFPMRPGVRIFVCSVFSWFVSSLWFVKFDFLFYCMVPLVFLLMC